MAKAECARGLKKAREAWMGAEKARRKDEGGDTTQNTRTHPIPHGVLILDGVLRHFGQGWRIFS